VSAQLLTAYAGQLQLILHILLVCICIFAFNQKKKKESIHAGVQQKNHSTYLVCQNRKKEIGNGIFNGTDADARKD